MCVCCVCVCMHVSVCECLCVYARDVLPNAHIKTDLKMEKAREGFIEVCVPSYKAKLHTCVCYVRMHYMIISNSHVCCNAFR
jgi:hypothetical protein